MWVHRCSVYFIIHILKASVIYILNAIKPSAMWSIYLYYLEKANFIALFIKNKHKKQTNKQKLNYVEFLPSLNHKV